MPLPMMPMMLQMLLLLPNKPILLQMIDADADSDDADAIDDDANDTADDDAVGEAVAVNVIVAIAEDIARISLALDGGIRVPLFS